MIWSRVKVGTNVYKFEGSHANLRGESAKNRLLKRIELHIVRDDLSSQMMFLQSSVHGFLGAID